MREDEIIDLLRGQASDGAARSLLDDAAVWSPPIGRDLVLTHDSIAEGVHYLTDDRPSDIAWKLIAVNLSDLAAKGATPSGILTSFALSNEDSAWLTDFVSGLQRVCHEHGVALWGGDTIRLGAGQRSVFGCTAIGHVAPEKSLARGGANEGDLLWVSGTVGDAGLGLAIRKGESATEAYLERRYRLPMPRLRLGQGLADTGATAAMDVSDGLLIDAARMASASGLAAEIRLDAVPLSEAAKERLPPGNEGFIVAATAGDDYEILFAAPKSASVEIEKMSARLGLPLTPVGYLASGSGLTAIGEDGNTVDVARQGWSHDR